MGINKKVSKKFSKFGQKVKRHTDKQNTPEDEEIILDNVERSGIELTSDEHLNEEIDICLICNKCQGKLYTTQGTTKTRYRCVECGTLYELVDKSKKKSRKKKAKKAGHRMWRACVTGWKYLKAGMVFYVHTPANGLNIPGMASQVHSQRQNDPVHKKYGYVYK